MAIFSSTDLSFSMSWCDNAKRNETKSSFELTQDMNAYENLKSTPSKLFRSPQVAMGIFHAKLCHQHMNRLDEGSYPSLRYVMPSVFLQSHVADEFFGFELKRVWRIFNQPFTRKFLEHSQPLMLDELFNVREKAWNAFGFSLSSLLETPKNFQTKLIAPFLRKNSRTEDL